MRERTSAFALLGLVIGDAPEAWSAAGFAVHDGAVRISDTVISCRRDLARGIVAIHIDGLNEPVDGLPIEARTTPNTVIAQHPNGVESIDHLVVLTPDCDRTTERFASVGLKARRVRRFEAAGSMRRQTFFWLGDVILELVGADETADVQNGGDGPAQAWGLALTCADLDATAAMLGDMCGEPKAAVQAGRRIATLRTRDLGISIPIALMSPHPDM